VPADSTGLPTFVTGDFGRSPVFGHISDMQESPTALEGYIVSVSVDMSDSGPACVKTPSNDMILL